MKFPSHDIVYGVIQQIKHVFTNPFSNKISQALFTASKMCVFDVLQRKPGLDAAQVAQEIKASEKGTQSLLEACVSLQLLKTKERSQPTLNLLMVVNIMIR